MQTMRVILLMMVMMMLMIGSLWGQPMDGAAYGISLCGSLLGGILWGQPMGAAGGDILWGAAHEGSLWMGAAYGDSSWMGAAYECSLWVQLTVVELESSPILAQTSGS